MSTTTNETKSPRFSLGWLSLDSWAVTAAVIFIVLVVAGFFPRVPW
jgi:hypothetical protein